MERNTAGVRIFSIAKQMGELAPCLRSPVMSHAFRLCLSIVKKGDRTICCLRSGLSRPPTWTRQYCSRESLVAQREIEIAELLFHIYFAPPTAVQN